MKKKIAMIMMVCCVGLIGCANETVPASATVSAMQSTEKQTITSIAETKTIVETVETRENANFRNAYWGDDIETVKKYETDILWTEETQKAIIGKSKVLNMNVDIGFTFGDGKLYQGAIMFNYNDHTNDNLYIDDYNTIKNALKEKYGEPNEDKQVWKNDLFKGDVSHYGTAISCGQLQYLAIWENENTRIILGLIGDNYKINLGIIYENVNHKEEINNSGL
ncbi:MAG: hypothetical protein LBS02_14040 [Hungatella sp.]|jgi:hypothetical protein|nr:hypothetical protein [Hungatella sp.]